MSTPIYGWIESPLGPAWDGSAYSLTALASDGLFWFMVPHATTGAVVGLNHNPGVSDGFVDMPFAFQVFDGFYRVLSYGVPQTSYAAYNEDHVFYLVRKGGYVYAMVGEPLTSYPDADFEFGAPGDRKFKSPAPYTPAVVLDACLYALNDSISDAGMLPTTYVVQDYNAYVDSGVARGSAYGRLSYSGVSGVGAGATSAGSFTLSGEAGGPAQGSGAVGQFTLSIFCGQGQHASAEPYLTLNGFSQGGYTIPFLVKAQPLLRPLRGGSAGRPGTGSRASLYLDGFAHEGPYAFAEGNLPIRGESTSRTYTVNQSVLASPGADADGLELDFVNSFTVGLSGRVMVNGVPTASVQVIARNYHTKEHAAVATSTSMGMWALQAPPGLYDITLSYAGMQTVVHGPYRVL